MMQIQKMHYMLMHICALITEYVLYFVSFVAVPMLYNDVNTLHFGIFMTLHIFESFSHVADKPVHQISFAN